MPSAAAVGPSSVPASSCASCCRSDGDAVSRVMGRPRASALPALTMRTFSAGRRAVVSSSMSCDGDADASAELKSDWRSVSSEGCGDPARARWCCCACSCCCCWRCDGACCVWCSRCVSLLFRLKGSGALTLTIFLMSDAACVGKGKEGTAVNAYPSLARTITPRRSFMRCWSMITCRAAGLCECQHWTKKGKHRRHTGHPPMRE